jgi:hypothetical protein
LFFVKLIELGIASFVVKENWGRGRRERGDIQRITLDFLPMVGQITVHHEPPKFEARPKVEIVVDHAGHAAIHWKRWTMFKKPEDYNAYSGQVSLMDEIESDLLEEMRDSREIMAAIGREIMRRR